MVLAFFDLLGAAFLVVVVMREDELLVVEGASVALADTVGTAMDSVSEALVCGKSSSQSQGSVP